MNIFWKSFYKTAGSLRKEVSTVAVMLDGKMLMGLRRKEQKYTAPGGHLDPKEDPLDGAVRELREESGIVADKKDLKFIKTITNKENGYTVHGYRLDLKERPKTTMQGDPDQEVTRWNFVDTKTIPDEKLHVPRKHGNVLLPEMEKEAAFKTNTVYQAIQKRLKKVYKANPIKHRLDTEERYKALKRDLIGQRLGKGTIRQRGLRDFLHTHNPLHGAGVKLPGEYKAGWLKHNRQAKLREAVKRVQEKFPNPESKRYADGKQLDMLEKKSAEKVKVPSFVNGDGLQYYLDKARALKSKIRE